MRRDFCGGLLRAFVIHGPDGPGSGPLFWAADTEFMDPFWTHCDFRVIVETLLLRKKTRCYQRVCQSPLTDLNRRPLPYHGSALPLS